MSDPRHRRYTPPWIAAKNRTRPKSYRDDADSTVASSPSCAFCAALEAAHDARLFPIELDELEREHGACTCLA